jgi:alkanesulfonate monooxygenase SsuD/methylene tetrahydromethanopterin reductase-like flavin-dependent oxidoreductase (luciferase family)
MQGCVAEQLLAFFREAVGAGARQAGRHLRAVDLVARVNVCIGDDRAAARQVMKPTIARSLAAQRPDFFTFVRAGLTVPPALARRLEGLGYTHDPGALREAAADVPEEFVDAVTLAGPPDEVAAGVIRLGQRGITQFIVYPLAADGRIETTIARFQREVMPAVRAAGL